MIGGDPATWFLWTTMYLRATTTIGISIKCFVDRATMISSLCTGLLLAFQEFHSEKGRRLVVRQAVTVI